MANNSVSASVTSAPKVTNTKPVNPGATFAGTVSPSFNANFTPSMITWAWSDSRTLNAASETFTLNNNTLSDPYGNTISATNLQHIYVRNKSISSTLNVGGGTNPVIPNVIPVQSLPSITSCLNLTGQFAVTGTTSVLKVDAGSASISYDILLFGA